MRARLHFCGFLICFVSCAVSSQAGAARLYLDSRPTNLDPNDHICRLIFREMPRQALIVAATEDFGVTCIDPTVEPAAAPRDGDVRIGLDQKALPDRLILRVQLFDAADHELGTFEIQQKANENRLVYLDDYAQRCDQEMETHWKEILATQLGTKPSPPRWDPTLTVPAETDRLLATVDFGHSFLAARLIHQSIRLTGESPARLGALVRAYAHLGDATSHLAGGQSIGFFARSLMYAQRLVRLAPDDPNTWWCRAYAETLYGISIAAEADLKRADDLAGKMNPPISAPSWVELTRMLLNFRTIDLSNQANGRDGPLASYFAWLTVEYSLLHSLPINFGNEALKQNPGALHVLDEMGDDAGVGLNHQITTQSSLVLNRLVASLAKDDAAPDAIRQAVQDAVNVRFDVPSILKLLEFFDAQADEPGQPLQWSTLASLVRESQFVNAVRRLSFVAYAFGTDPSDEREGWLRLLGNHRYVDFIRSYQSPTRAMDPALAAKVRSIDFKDDTMSADLLIRHLEMLGLSEDPRRKVSWATRHREQSGNTAVDLARSIWRYRFAGFEEGDSYLDFCRAEAKSLDSVRPNHPLALAMLVITDWPEMEKKIPQIDVETISSPIVAFALGSAYARTDRKDNAVRLLQDAARYAPDRIVYDKLAAVYLAQNDKQAWLAAWNKYFDTSEDFGLDHAKAAEEIAYRLVSMGDLDTALKYAERSASSGSAWGLDVNAYVLLRMGQYEKAEELSKDSAERYDTPLRYYLFCRMTGRGNLNAAKAASRGSLADAERTRTPGRLIDAGLYYELEGDLDKASALWQRAADADKNDPYYGLLAGLGFLDRNKPDQALPVLQAASQVKVRSRREHIYNTCILELIRCVKDSAALPARDGEIGKLIADHSMAIQCGNVCYVLGRICELNHHNDDAKWWYRASMDGEAADFTCRALSATALRRMGDEYYK